MSSATTIAPKLRRSHLAALCGVSVKTISNWVKAGLFPRPARVGNVLLWDAIDVQAALDKLKQQGGGANG